MPFLWHCSTNGKLCILVKAQPAPQAPGHCHQLGLVYGRETWVYPTNTLSATVTFLLLPRLRQGITTLATNLDGGLLSTLKRKISPHLNQYGVLSLTTPNGSSAPATSLSLTSQLNLMTQNQPKLVKCPPQPTQPTISLPAALPQMRIRLF